MKVSELAGRAGISIATIKYYIREGLLPAGELSAPNQASYGDRHLERLQLIRALREVGGLGVDATRHVLQALDVPGPSSHSILGDVMDAMALASPEDDLESERTAVDREAFRVAVADVSQLIADAHWEISADAGARRELAAVLATVRRIWIPDFLVQGLVPYVETANRLVDFERAVVEQGDPRVGIEGVDMERPDDEAVRSMVLGTVLFERAIVALRRMAHEDRSHRGAGLSANHPDV
ncbi:MAG TPA: MerR family transcriptional regulator [Dehalococcoidia bacterium]|nr:MerR family transcriptional regulator [Dehalococcoidia bacterium]